MNDNSNKFKLILMAIFGFFILLGLVAFSTYKAKSPTNSGVEIKVWGTINKTVFDNYIQKFKDSKGVTFKLTYTYKSLDTIDSALVEAIATGKSPDAILIPQELEKRYLDKVYIIPFSTLPERTMQDTFIQEAGLYTQQDGFFALPLFVDPLVMYWNKDSFSSAGIAIPPKKWAEFPALASKLSVSDNTANITKSVASLGEFQNVDNAKAILSALIMQAGSPIVSLNSSNVFQSQLNSQSTGSGLIPAVSALQFYTDYSNPKKSVYSWNKSLPDSKQSFLSEDLATYFGFASEYTDIKNKNPNLNFDVATLPQVVDTASKVTFGNLYGFGMLKTSPNIKDTFSLLSLLIGADSVSILAQYMDVAPARLDLISAGNADPAKTVFYNSALISRGWIDPDLNKTNQIFQDMVENVTIGKTSVQEAVANASTQIDNLLR
jgi:ABC-type glycerol-3-phosphate transport system substrate-binding protein